MEERSCQAKWVIREKINELWKVLNVPEEYIHTKDVRWVRVVKVETIDKLLQDILNIVENEL